jgi:hypothetical protein
MHVKTLLILSAVIMLSVGIGACGRAGEKARREQPAPPNSAGSRVPSSSDATAEMANDAQPNAPGHDPYESVGAAAGTNDRRVIVAAVRRYFAAAVAGDGATACSLLTRPLAKSVAEDYGNMRNLPELRGRTCRAVMSKLFRHRQGRPTRDIAGIEVTGVRVVEGASAVALLRSSTVPLGEMALHRENGVWRMAQLLGGSSY